MPNRILREGILTSERVDALASWASECFYRRLHSVVDDFGRYYANPSLLRAACYPLKLDKVSNADIGKWLADCAGAALVSTYEIDGKRYLQLSDFRQQVRATASKFPQAPDKCEADAQRMRSTSTATAHLVVDVDGDVVEDDKSNVGLTPDAASLAKQKSTELRKAAADVIGFLNAKAGRNYDANGANADHVIARLKDGETVGDLRAVIAMKCRDWKGDEKMAEYLRPETLFGRTKFASYKGKLLKREEIE